MVVTTGDAGPGENATVLPSARFVLEGSFCLGNCVLQLLPVGALFFWLRLNQVAPGYVQLSSKHNPANSKELAELTLCVRC